MTDHKIQTQARTLGAELVGLWANYSDENDEQSEVAMRDVTKEIRALDLHQVDGVLASPLNYWVRAELDDENPEDLTFCEMIESIEISLKLMRAEAVAPPYMSGHQIQTRFNPD